MPARTVSGDRLMDRPKSGAGLLLGRLGGTQPLGLDALDPAEHRAPNPPTLHGSANGRATRAVLALGVAVRAPAAAPAGRRTPPGLPARLRRSGGVTPSPLLNRSVGAPIAAGAAICWRHPWQRAEPVGGARLAGRRLNAWPHVLRRGPIKMRLCGKPLSRPNSKILEVALRANDRVHRTSAGVDELLAWLDLFESNYNALPSRGF